MITIVFQIIIIGVLIYNSHLINDSITATDILAAEIEELVKTHKKDS